MGGIVGITNLCFGTKDPETAYFGKARMYFTLAKKWYGYCLDYYAFISILMK